MWGQDVEYWAGNFGTRFKKERVVLVLVAEVQAPIDIQEEDRRSLQLKFGEKAIPITEPYFSSFYNSGKGKTYYINGELQFAKCWSHLGEFDWTLGLSPQCLALTMQRHQ